MSNAWRWGLLLGLVASAGAVQTPAAGALDAVSIAYLPDVSGTVGISGRLMASARPSVDPQRMALPIISLQTLIGEIYAVPSYRISGPGWLETERYSVMATSTAPISRDEFLHLLQPVVAERFHLAIHWETKPFHGYVLNVAPGGSKLQEPSAAAGTGTHLFIFPQMASGGSLISGTASLPGLATTLASVLQAPVADATGIEGTWSFRWNPPGLDAGTLSASLQENFGLRLDPLTAPQPVLVIDHAERLPSGN